MHLNEVQTGQIVRVKNIQGKNSQHERLRDLGIRPGIQVRVLQRLSFGGLVIEAGQGFFALRTEEAGLLEVEI